MTTHGLVETVENTLKTIIEEITSQLDNNLTTTVTIASSTFTTSTIEWTNTESRLFHSIAYQLQSELTATDNSSTVAILKRLQFDAECLLDRRKFALHAVPYQTVSTDSLRRFSSCALLRGTIELVIAYRYIKYLWASNLEIKRDEIKYHLEKSIEILDTGLIMAGALGTEQCVHSLIDAANQLLVSISIDCNIDRTENTKRRRLVSDTVTEDSSWLVALQTLLDRQHTATTTIPALSTELKKGCRPLRAVKRISSPSLTDYHRQLAQQVPFIITHGNGVQDWPAMKRWCDATYLVDLLGHRWVPVELGHRYTDAQWQQQLMRFDVFLRDYVVATKKTVGYLAQHDLFHQVPRLRRDIQVPDYCFAMNEATLPSVQTHAWFGPAGTISPLHHDPDRNLFAQVVGRKQFRFYAPNEPVYPHESDTMLHNTSQLDVEQPDWHAFPDFINAQGYDCILNPGDLLYIPPRWWHYVRALDTSFSVSFWF